MNFYKLTRQLKFSNIEFDSNFYFYIPADPYQIYERLIKIYLFAKLGKKPKLLANNKVLPYKIFEKTLDYSSLYVLRDYSSLHVLKWIYQGIPEAFWKFNTYIDANIDRLIESAKKDNCFEIWVDMKGRFKKLKAVKIIDTVLEALQEGRLYLPSYAQIVKEVHSWGNYTYQFDDVKQIYTVWKGGDMSG